MVQPLHEFLHTVKMGNHVSALAAEVYGRGEKRQEKTTKSFWEWWFWGIVLALDW